MISDPKCGMPGLYYVAVNPSYYFHIENSNIDNRHRFHFLILFSDIVQNVKQHGYS